MSLEEIDFHPENFVTLLLVIRSLGVMLGYVSLLCIPLNGQMGLFIGRVTSFDELMR